MGVPEEKKPPIEAQAKPAESNKPADEKANAVRENFETKKKEMADLVDETFEKNISSGSNALDERALSRIRGMKEKQKKAIAELFEKRQKDFEAKHGQATADREQIANKLLSDTTQEAKTKIIALEAIIKKNKKETYITTDEAYEIEKAVLGVESLALKDKDMQEMIVRFQEGGDLKNADYEKVITLIDRYDFKKDRKDLQHTFEATSAGVLIGLMTEAQRYTLVLKFMDSEKKKDTALLIDGFLKTGILTRYQGEALFQEAVAKKIISKEQFEADFKKKLESGSYEKEVADFKKIIEQEKARDFRGIYSDNIVNRVVGAPGLGALGALWGGLVAFMNLFVILANKNNEHKLESILKNPYIYMGLGAAAVGTEIASGTVKKGTDLLGAGYIGRGLKNIDEPADAAKTTVEKNAESRISEIILNSPKPLVDYLDNGGYATILALRNNKIHKEQRAIITIDELIALEKNDAQKGHLENMKHMEFVSVDGVNQKLTMVSEASAILQLDNADKFKKRLDDLKAKQKPKVL